MSATAETDRTKLLVFLLSFLRRSHPSPTLSIFIFINLGKIVVWPGRTAALLCHHRKGNCVR